MVEPTVVSGRWRWHYVEQELAGLFWDERWEVCDGNDANIT